VGWLSGWGRRKKGTIQGTTAGAQTDYQMRMTVHKGTGTDSPTDVYCGGNCRDDFGDIRWCAEDGTTLLSYWIEELVSGDYAVFWVKIPSIPASPDSVDVYMYYDNPSATSLSDGDATFLLFDDFAGTDIDTTKWDKLGTAGTNYKVEDGYLKFISPPAGIRTKTAIGVNRHVLIEWRFTRTDGTNPIPVDDTNRKPYDYFKEPVADEWGINFSSDVNEGIFAMVDDIAYWRYYTSTQNQIVETSTAGWRKNWLVWSDTCKGFRDDITPNERWSAPIGDLRYWYYNTTSGWTNTGRVPAIADGFKFEIYHFESRGNNTWYDWIFVRKYASPEPTWGAWGSEETAVVGKPPMTLMGV